MGAREYIPKSATRFRFKIATIAAATRSDIPSKRIVFEVMVFFLYWCYIVLSSPQFFLNQPTDSEDQQADTGVAKFEAEVVILEADNQAIHDLEKADGLNDFGDQPECTIQR